MDDDLNTPKAVAAIFDLCRQVNRGRDNELDVSSAIETIQKLTGVLGLTLEAPPTAGGLTDEEIEYLVQQRKDARENKEWDVADSVRDKLDAAGISISDSGNETTWSRD